MCISVTSVRADLKIELGVGIDGIAIFICDRKASLSVLPGVNAQWLPIWGETQLSAPRWQCTLHRGDIHVADFTRPYEASISANGACVVIATLSGYRSRQSQTRSYSPAAWKPFPATYRGCDSLVRRFLSVVRRAVGGITQFDRQSVRYALLQLVDEMEEELTDAISSCPGISLKRRRETLYRMLCARNVIEFTTTNDVDILEVAREANYSIGHFIKIFYAIFGETPYASFIRKRIENAKAMLLTSDLGVGEIAQASGFFSPASFSRAMKQQTGTSATQFRAARKGD
jgi:AraC-like DNA-binding protein